MGVVYKALDTRLDRTVALKFLSPEMNRDEISKKRFIQEAKAASALDHPNICTIYEINETDDGFLFIAMAYYEGDTLKNKLQSSALALNEVVHFATQVAAGLAKAHSRGIVHRDIKPANLIVTRDHAVKIVDFGLAKLTLGSSDLTQSGSAVGTAAYMSPEQAQGQAVDHRTDIWSWGVVLYEMLSGQMPFHGENHISLFHSIVYKDPSPVSALRTGLMPGFDRFISQVLNKDPEKRHSSIFEAAEELKRLLGTQDGALAVTKSIGYSITDSKSLMPKIEKKQIVILKIQIPAYADLLESVSSLVFQQIFGKIQEKVQQIADSSGGTINQFSGEETTLVYGIPTAHENDLLRAAHASIAIHDAIMQLESEYQNELGGTSLSPQSGLAAGLVVVRPSDSPDRQCELTGNAVQTAFALASHADAGEVWMTEEGRRPVERFFQTEGREEIRLKGKSKKLTAYRIVAPLYHSRFDVWEKEELTVYAGRDRELSQLMEKMDEARGGQGQFVSVIGEAGSGKSRLLYEFRKRLDAQSFRILQGGSHVYASNVAYLPFIEVLREDLKLREKGNSEQVVVEQIKKLNPSLMDFVPVYLHLLTIPSSEYALPRHFQGKQLQPAITEALCAYIISNKEKPVVLLLEDWHAADEASRNILEQQQEMICDHPVLIVVTCRPEYSFKPAAHHTTLYLKALDSQACETVMRSSFNADRIPQQLAELIAERTGGNPFFIEEICQSLREEGLIKVENRRVIPTQTLSGFRLPDTVQSVIGSRLDRIEAAPRSVLEIASVIGREFNRSLLQKLTPDEAGLFKALDTLKELGLIQQIRVFPEATYKFKHPLLQETAYDRLLAQDRKILHGRVAEAMEQLYAGRLEEYHDVLAHHFAIAEKWEKAVQYGREAARKANDVGDFNAALLQLERVQEWLTRLPDQASLALIRIEILLDHERLCDTLGIRDRQEQILSSVISELQQTKAPELLMESYRRLGELYTVVGRYADSETALEQSLQLSLEIGDVVGERNARRSKGFLYWNAGRNEEAIANNELALAIDRDRNDSEGLARDLLNLASILRGMGRYEEALQCGEEALKNMETVEDPIKRATAFHVVANVFRDQGDNERALHYLEQALEVSTRDHVVIAQSFQLNAIAHIYAQRGLTGESIKMLQQSIDLCRKSGYADGLAHSVRAMGEILLNSKQEEAALSAFEEAAFLFTKVKDGPNAAFMYASAASLYEKLGRFREAIKAWTRIKDLREQMQDPEGVFAALEQLGRLSRANGDPENAIRYYATAAEMTGKKDAKAALLNTLGILQWSCRNYSAALTYFQNAFRLFEETGDSIHAGLMLNSIGVSFKELGRGEEAVAALTKAIEWNRKTNERLLEGHGLSALADILIEQGDRQKAIECLNHSLAIRKQIRDRKGEGWMLYRLATVHFSANSAALAHECVSEASAIAAECEDSELMLACKKLIETTIDRPT